MLAPNTTVFTWVHHPPYSGQRAWIASYETVRNNLGELVIKPRLDDDPAAAKSMSYQEALILKRRIESENVLHNVYELHFSLNPTGDEVGAGNTTAAPTEDNRVVMSYRGLLVRPGVSVNHGRCWYVRFPNQPGQPLIESVRGSTPEEAVDTVYQRNLQSRAEQAPPPPPPPPEAAQQSNFRGRIRPGDLNA